MTSSIISPLPLQLSPLSPWNKADNFQHLNWESSGRGDWRGDTCLFLGEFCSKAHMWLCLWQIQPENDKTSLGSPIWCFPWTFTWSVLNLIVVTDCWRWLNHWPAVVATLPIAVFTVPVMGLSHSRPWTRPRGSWRLGSPNALLILWLEVRKTLEKNELIKTLKYKLFHSSTCVSCVRIPAAQVVGSEERPGAPSGERWLAEIGPAACG